LKIVAHTNDHARSHVKRVLVEMTAEELARLVGHYGDYDLKGRCSSGLEVGTTYNVSDIYQIVRRQLEAANTLASAKKQLDALSSMLDVINPGIHVLCPPQESEKTEVRP
jgi:hypothetical protein